MGPRATHVQMVMGMSPTSRNRDSWCVKLICSLASWAMKTFYVPDCGGLSNWPCAGTMAMLLLPQVQVCSLLQTGLKQPQEHSDFRCTPMSHGSSHVAEGPGVGIGSGTAISGPQWFQSGRYPWLATYTSPRLSSKLSHYSLLLTGLSTASNAWAAASALLGEELRG